MSEMNEKLDKLDTRVGSILELIRSIKRDGQKSAQLALKEMKHAEAQLKRVTSDINDLKQEIPVLALPQASHYAEAQYDNRRPMCMAAERISKREAETNPSPRMPAKRARTGGKLSKDQRAECFSRFKKWVDDETKEFDAFLAARMERIRKFEEGGSSE